MVSKNTGAAICAVYSGSPLHFPLVTVIFVVQEYLDVVQRAMFAGPEGEEKCRLAVQNALDAPLGINSQHPRQGKTQTYAGGWVGKLVG